MRDAHRRRARDSARRISRRMPPTNGTDSRSLEGEQAGAQAVIDIVGVIGDVVGDRRDLRLGAGIAPELEIAAGPDSRGSRAARRSRR